MPVLSTRVTLFYVTLFALLLGYTQVMAQGVSDVVARTDKRTLRERADEVMKSGTADAEAIVLYEGWLNAVPTDTAAARQLAILYERAGRSADAAAALLLATVPKAPVDARLQTINTLQVRMGTYKVLLPTELKPAQKYPAVLVLHGNGHTEDTMVEWARQLKMDSVIFVFPRAPYVKLPEVMASQRPRYSGSGTDLGFPDSLLTDVVEATAAWYHDALIDASVRFPVSKVKPIVVGFSQGGFLSYAVATKYPQTFQSVVSICASMYQYGNVKSHLSDLASYGIDVMVLHAKQDPVVPFQTGELLWAMLQDAKVRSTFVPFDGVHWPSASATSQVREWLTKRLR